MRSGMFPVAGVSDFSYEGAREAAYPSYYVDQNRTVTNCDISPETHQAVLNEIAARPSNLG